MTATPAHFVAIALGSNMGERRANLAGGLTAIAALPTTVVVSASAPFDTVAVGPIAQANFLNAAATIRTDLSPLELLGELHRIERAFGRDRATIIRFGPRTLDLDIVVYGDSVMALPDLTLPHPRAHERLFVLEPLAAIAPDLVIPGRGTVRQLLADLRIQLISGAVPPPESSEGADPCLQA